MYAQLKSTRKGFGKGFGIAAATTAAAISGHLAAGAVGLPPMLLEGAAGGAVLALGVRQVVSRMTPSETVRDWQVMNTEVPDVIEQNEFMTVVSNPYNDLGVYVWDKEDGYQIGVFDSKDIRESVWLYDDEQVQTVVNLLSEGEN